MKAMNSMEISAGVSDEGGSGSRNVKASFRDGNGKGYGARSKGSRFAALQQVNDDFGRAEAGSDVEPMQNCSKPASSSAHVVDFSPKICTQIDEAWKMERFGSLKNKDGAIGLHE
ncbi:hypothetical protein ACE6H2_020451 [Prunus campanulata]